MEKNSVQSLEKKVLSAIETRQLKPKSRWYFFTQSAALGAGLVITALLLLFFTSLIIFHVRHSGSYLAPGFGFYGLTVFFQSLPWLLIGLVTLLLIVLETLLQRYKFNYQRPMLYSFAGAALLVSLGTLAISQGHMHESLMEKVRREPKIFGGPFYKHLGMPKNHKVTVGTVTETNQTGCSLKSHENENWQVLIDERTKLPYGYKISNGDTIMVMGPKIMGTIHAVGIKPVR